MLRRLGILALVLFAIAAFAACTTTTCATDPATGATICQEEKGLLDTWDDFIQGAGFFIILAGVAGLALAGWIIDTIRKK